MDVLHFAKDNNTAWALISDDGEPEVLYEVDFAKGTREKLFSAGDYSVGTLLTAGFDGEPFAVYSDAPKPSIQYLDNSSEWAKLHAGLMKQFACNLVGMEEFSRDNSKVLVSVSGDRNPGQYYILDRTKNSIGKALDSYEGIDPTKLAAVRVLEFSTADGLKLGAMLTVPTTGSAPYPMVVMSHGGPFGPCDALGFDGDAQFFAHRGYAVLQVNYRGSGGRGENLEKSGYKQWGGKIMDDIAAGVRYTIDNGLADKDRICTYGASFGGYAALMNPIRYPELYKCAIGYVGVYDLAYMATKGDINDTRRGRFPAVRRCRWSRTPKATASTRKRTASSCTRRWKPFSTSTSARSRSKPSRRSQAQSCERFTLAAPACSLSKSAMRQRYRLAAVR